MGAASRAKGAQGSPRVFLGGTWKAWVRASCQRWGVAKVKMWACRPRLWEQVPVGHLHGFSWCVHSHRCT